MAQDFVWQNGERVWFLGDSITGDPNGFPLLVQQMVTARYPELGIDYTVHNMGGNRMGDVIERLPRDVFDGEPRPSWIIVGLGANDVQHGATGTPPGRFRELYDELLIRLQDRKATLLCLTPTVLSDDLENEKNQAVRQYAQAVRDIAFAHGAQVVDALPLFEDALRQAHSRDPEFHYISGLNLNTSGQILLALAVLSALHFQLPVTTGGSPGMEQSFGQAA